MSSSRSVGRRAGYRRVGVTAAVSLVILAGCGTTVPLADRGSAAVSGAGQNGAGGSSQLSMGSTGAGASGSVRSTGTGIGSADSGSPSSGAGTAGSGSGGSGGTGGSSSATVSGTGASGGTFPSGDSGVTPGAGVDGPGVTATTITIGGVYSSDAAAADSALGAANSNPGNVEAYFQAMQEYMNAHGGIAHRHVNLVMYDESLTESSTEIAQGACDDWVQDNKTFVLDGINQIVLQCAQSAGAISVEEDPTYETGPEMAQYPSFFNIDGFTLDRGAAVTVDALADQGYFTPGAKVGVVTWDDPDYEYAMTNGALPALAAHGVKNVQEAFVAVPDTDADLGETSASAGSAVLKFHSEGIDHVILFDGPAGINSSGVLVLEWTQQANSQGYYPKYGLNSESGFSGLASDYPEKELIGSEGPGWVPVSDLSTTDFAALPETADEKACFQAMAAAGQTATNNNEETLQLLVCDEFFFLQQAFDAITGPLDQQTALAAIDKLGSSYPDPTTFGTYFSASQHDGAQLVRNMEFVPSCDCYRYSGPAYNPAA